MLLLNLSSSLSLILATSFPPSSRGLIIPVQFIHLSFFKIKSEKMTITFMHSVLSPAWNIERPKETCSHGSSGRRSKVIKERSNNYDIFCALEHLWGNCWRGTKRGSFEAPPRTIRQKQDNMHGNVKEETERLLKAPGTRTNYQKEHIKNKCVIMLTINIIMFVPAATLSCVCVWV